MYEKQVAHYQCAISVIWKNRNEIGILFGSGQLGPGPTGPGSRFSVMSCAFSYGYAYWVII